MIIAVFDPLPLTMCINCSFFTYIFAVLLPDLSRLSCHSAQRMFQKSSDKRQNINQTAKQNFKQY